MWRTWFGLYGLCKLLWNDVVPANNYMEKEPAKIPDHVRNYLRAVEGMTGVEGMTEARMLEQSARVHNLQRLMCFMLGKGTRIDDIPPYRSMGPVTAEEYQSRYERYDKQLVEILKLDITNMTVEQKMASLRSYREEQYRQLVDVVYRRRGWDSNGVPTVARLKELGIDLPELVALVPAPRLG